MVRRPRRGIGPSVFQIVHAIDPYDRFRSGAMLVLLYGRSTCP